jgi:16S rRNA (adenine1518-N6/adenine1519-N6)-dimethyltransferase
MQRHFSKYPPDDIEPIARKHLSKRLGQHFLIDRNILIKIAKALRISSGDLIMEIGGGTGNLTSILFEHPVESVTVFEVDSHLASILRRKFKAEKRLRLHHQDFLKADIAQLFRREGSRKFKVVSNVPYSISTRIVTTLIAQRCYFRSMVLMLQKEFARRLTAVPSTRDYGALTLFVRYHADVSRRFSVSRHCFFPKPKVDSTVVEITPVVRPESHVFDETLLFSIIRTAFRERRKMLRNALGSIVEEVSKGGGASELESLTGIDFDRRPETLALKEFILLANTVFRMNNRGDRE